jgi:hypothetical protein
MYVTPACVSFETTPVAISFWPAERIVVSRSLARTRHLCFLWILETCSGVYILKAHILSEVKTQRRETDHLSPFSVELKNEGSFTSSPPYTFVAALCLLSFNNNTIKFAGAGIAYSV